MSSAVPIVAVVTLLLAVGMGGLAFFLGYVAGKSSAASGPADFASAAAVAERDAFIEHLRELAWQNRDVSPELATILIDDITSRRTQLTRNLEKDH